MVLSFNLPTYFALTMTSNAGPSHVLSSSSSSSSSLEDEYDLTNIIEAQSQAIHVQQQALSNVYANNNLLMAYYMNNEENDARRKGSIPGHRVIYRGRAEAEYNLWVDYFAENPRYNEAMFRRRFRMSRTLFLRIVNAVESHDTYFKQWRDGCGKLGLSSLQKNNNNILNVGIW